MKLEIIREIASGHGIKVGKMRKGEVVRAIQEAEGNRPCFESGEVAACGQVGCLWREDCV